MVMNAVNAPLTTNQLLPGFIAAPTAGTLPTPPVASPLGEPIRFASEPKQAPMAAAALAEQYSKDITNGTAPFGPRRGIGPVGWLVLVLIIYFVFME